MELRHTWWKILLILLLFCPIVLVLIVSQFGVQTGILNRCIVTTYTSLYLDIIPCDPILQLWHHVTIYLWQLLWVIYVSVCICRKTARTFVYQLPVYPPITFALMILNLFMNTGWLIAFDRYKLEGALVLSIAVFLTVSVSLFIAYKCCHDNMGTMRRQGLTKDVWLIRVLMHEGLAVYGAWAAVATLINFSMSLTYRWDIDQTPSCLISLSLLTFAVVAWFLLDVVFYQYTQWTFGPYIVVIISVCGMLYRSYDLDRKFSVSIFLVAVLVLTSLTMGTKIAVWGYRHVIKQSKKERALKYPKSRDP